MATSTLDKRATLGKETLLAEGQEMVPGATRQVVALQLAGEVYGLDISAIHTVITPQAITAVPKAPGFVRGVINLRGRVLPVIDLRARFGLPPLPEAQSAHCRTVIVEVGGVSAGLIVDGVSEVLHLPEAAIDPPSQLIASATTGCVTGIGRLPGRDGVSARLIILLDAPSLLTGADGMAA